MNTVSKLAIGGTTAVAGTTAAVTATLGGRSTYVEEVTSKDKKIRKFDEDKKANEQNLPTEVLNSVWYRKKMLEDNIDVGGWLYIGNNKDKIKQNLEGKGYGGRIEYLESSFQENKNAIDSFLRASSNEEIRSSADKLKEENDKVEHTYKWCEIANKITEEPGEQTDANSPYGIFSSWCFEWIEFNDD
ncbi:hypothetical protein MHSWG343_05470 [Candidatus Mycoplasma haematohominis]|uniref:Uncharacterized protein n=1 Tax=Candidatus Mycoplasma haematohominis TaxID=1494318 RepID=A0A478FU41_9MOLU|nr:hypothetical protein MHSWG343_05470 [Candidatus Mycoplasma haemohominis]